MAKYEIERKWTIHGCESPWITNAIFKEEYIIYQWYIVATDDAQVRVSQRKEKEGDRYTLNIKTGNGLTRKEVRIDITYKDFIVLIGQCDEVRPIKKHLYMYNLPGNIKLEISRVDDDWWYAEVEFEDEEKARAFDIHPYLTLCTVTDRTGDSYYAMKNYWRRTRLNEMI